MKNKSLVITLLIIGGIVILAVGYLGGILFRAQKTVTQLEKTSKLIEVMSSKMIPSIVAVGEVTNISERNITLKAHTNEEKPLTISIKIANDAELTSFVFPTAGEEGEGVLGAPTREEIEFKEIKVGSNVNVSLKILPDASFEGTSVIVFPSISL